MKAVRKNRIEVNAAVALSVSRDLSVVEAGRLSSWLENGEVFLVDIREPDEFEDNRIGGSFLVPMSRLDVERFPRLKGLKTALVCRDGFLAPVVRDELIAAGLENVYALEGGLTAWTSAGFELDD